MVVVVVLVVLVLVVVVVVVVVVEVRVVVKVMVWVVPGVKGGLQVIPGVQRERERVGRRLNVSGHS